jgi:hypothetical protein
MTNSRSNDQMTALLAHLYNRSNLWLFHELFTQFLIQMTDPTILSLFCSLFPFVSVPWTWMTRPPVDQ